MHRNNATLNYAGYLGSVGNYLSRGKYVFLSTIIAGLIIHFPAYSERLTDIDGVHVYFSNYYDTKYNLLLGRWMQYLFAKLTNNYVLPALSVCYSLVILGCSAVIIWALFGGTKRKISAVLIGSVLAAYPSVGDSLATYFYSAYHTNSVFLSICAVAAAAKIKNRYLAVALGSVLLAVSCGFYQANIGVAVALSLIYLMFMTIREDANLKDVFAIASKCLAMGICGITTYLLITKIVCSVANITLSSYAGIDHMGVIPLAEIPGLINRAFRASLGFYFGDGYYNNDEWNRAIIYVVIAICGLVAGFLEIRRQGLARVRWRMVFLVCCFLLLPIALNIMIVFVPEKIPSTNMTMSLVLPLIAVIMLFDKLSMTLRLEQILQSIAFAAVIALVFSFTIYLNTAYALMQMNYDRTYATAVRVIDRVETTQGYTPNMKMMVVGTGDDGNYPRLYRDVYLSVDGTNAEAGQIDYELLGAMAWGWRCFFENNLGLTYVQLSEAECQEIIGTDEYKSMAVFPDEGCTKLINDVMVVKLTGRFG